ncbi:MAG: hypothetical protein MUF27_06190 [Acidobacteria bacterium]|jgi:hypothetical protein|nr:hypothetical protein [Acidobacteriota bacterium]
MGSPSSDPLAPVIDALSVGWRRMAWLLFQGPQARLENWIWWGLIALLAGALGNHWGTGGSWRDPDLLRSGSRAAEASGLPPDAFSAFESIAWTVPLIATLVGLAVLLALGLLYLRCRFRFVLLDGVLSGAPRIREVFPRTAAPGLAYFLFELLLLAAALVLILPLLVIWWPIVRDALNGWTPEVGDLALPVLFSVAYGLPVGIALGLAEWFAHDFVVPLAWTTDAGFWGSFRRAGRLVFSSLGPSLFYLLLRLLLGLVGAFAITFATCFSCCAWAWPAALGVVAVIVIASFPASVVLLGPIAAGAFFLAAWIVSVAILPISLLFRAWSYAYVRVLEPTLPDWYRDGGPPGGPAAPGAPPPPPHAPGWAAEGAGE